MDQQVDNKIIIQYLLRQLSQQEQERFEERYFGDHNLFEQMLIIRDELIEDYLSGQLAVEDRMHFERYFMASPQQRQRVELARQLAQSTPQPSVTTWPTPAVETSEPIPLRTPLMTSRHLDRITVLQVLLAATIVLLFLGGYLLVRSRNQLARLQADRLLQEQREQDLEQQLNEQRTSYDELVDELKRERDHGDPHNPQQLKPILIASLVLTSDYDKGTKGTGGPLPEKMILSSSVRFVQLQLKLGSEYSYKYNVSLRDVSSGEEIWARKGLKAKTTTSGQAVFVLLPNNLFGAKSRGYILNLEGVTDGGTVEYTDKYSFQVLRK